MTTPCEEETLAISMSVNKWEENQMEKFSPVQYFKGYPWRLRLIRCRPIGEEKRHRIVMSLICDMSSESELWECTTFIGNGSEHTYCSWDKHSLELRFISDPVPEDAKRLLLPFSVKESGENWRRRPTLDPLAPRDGIIVIGEEKKKVYVNKESLASQSSFFDRLFNSDFKEKYMAEIPIGDVGYEEFANIIRMVYGFDGASLTDQNVHRALELSDRFDLKIVEDRVVSFLLSSSSSIPIHQKLVIAEQYNIPFLKERLIRQCTGTQMKELKESQEFDELSMETLRALFKKSCDLIA